MSNIEKLKKILALAKDGIGGEAENAQKLLDSLLFKAGLRIEDIQDEEIEDHYPIKYKGDMALFLLKQICFMVKEVPQIYCYTHKGYFHVKCTTAEYVTIKYLFGVYLPVLKQTINNALYAFIIKNRIFNQTPSKDDDIPAREDKTDIEKQIRIMSMMNGVDFVQVHKAIRNGEVPNA